jgi:hypothetical protein
MLVKRRRAPVYNLGTRGKYIVLYACSAWMCQDVLGFFRVDGFQDWGCFTSIQDATRLVLLEVSRC